MLEIPHKYQWRFPASRFRFPISLAPRTVMFIYPIFPLIYEKPSRFTEPENLTSFVFYPLMNLTTGRLLPIKWAKCFSRRVRVEKYPHCKALLTRVWVLMHWLHLGQWNEYRQSELPHRLFYPILHIHGHRLITSCWVVWLLPCMMLFSLTNFTNIRGWSLYKDDRDGELVGGGEFQVA